MIDTMTNVLDNAKAAPQPKPAERPRNAGHLKHLFLRCFLANVLAATVVGIGLAIHIGSLLDGPGSLTTDSAAAVFAAIGWPIALGIAVIISVAAGIFLFLTRGIAIPLEKTAAASGRLADGNLGATLPDHLPNEIGRIGESINGLSVNFQETLILIWNQTENAIAKIQHTTEMRTPDGKRCIAEDMASDLHSARQDLETMRMMVRSFDLYDVTVTANDRLAAKEAVKPLN
jgi:methyl-accepting chemotaxis protein